MSEDEAKGKWCPFVRLAAPADSEAAGTAGNRFGDSIDGNFRCIGSACMAWRWAEDEKAVYSRATGSDIAIGVLGTSDQRAANKASLVASRRGFCGLAGHP